MRLRRRPPRRPAFILGEQLAHERPRAHLRRRALVPTSRTTRQRLHHRLQVSQTRRRDAARRLLRRRARTRPTESTSRSNHRLFRRHPQRPEQHLQTRSRPHASGHHATVTFPSGRRERARRRETRAARPRGGRVRVHRAHRRLERHRRPRARRRARYHPRARRHLERGAIRRRARSRRDEFVVVGPV